MEIRTVTVVGATGTMGANVAGVFASFGNAKVYCIGRDIEKMKRRIPSIVKSVKADSIAAHLVPADLSMLEQCVAESDLVFESVCERLDIKKEMAARIGRVLQPHAVACTGSSGLSVTALAECLPRDLQGHFFGIHMFNPPYSMSLCELVCPSSADEAMKAELTAYLKNVLFRAVVEVKDSPAFLANRIGFRFINEALRYAEKYKDNGGIDYIDAILGPFTGRVMPPLVTADFVGLDVHKAIVDNVYRNTNDFFHESFALPAFVQKLIDEGRLGSKTGAGLYRTVKYDDGSIHTAVYDLNLGEYREKVAYEFPFSEMMMRHLRNGDYRSAFECLTANHSQEAQICLSFLLEYIVYSLYAVREVGYATEAADDAMATGFNWCPPLAMYGALSEVADVRQLIAERIGNVPGADVDDLLSDVKPSKYDYRVYFKSGR